MESLRSLEMGKRKGLQSLAAALLEAQSSPEGGQLKDEWDQEIYSAGSSKQKKKFPYQTREGFTVELTQ